MKRLTTYLLVFIGSLNLAFSQTFPSGASLGKTNPWTERDLMKPAALASLLSNGGKSLPYIFNIGVVENILGARSIGAVSKSESLTRFKNALQTLPRTSAVVIYCGCCPFSKCPNIRPAYSLMKEMGFKNGKLLDLPVNINQDWISKGYPMAGKN